ncbi:MAG: DUF167 domain-containing protein [Rickettsiales bacterium]
MLFTDQLPIKIYSDKILLYVKITPKASSTRFGAIFNNYLKIYITEVAEDGKANKFVVNLLAEKLKISKNNITIIQGATSTNKTICITGDINNIIKIIKTII